MKQIYIAIFIAFIVNGANAQEYFEFTSKNAYVGSNSFEKNLFVEIHSEPFETQDAKTSLFKAVESIQTHIYNGIRYKIISNEEKTVEVTHLGDIVTSMQKYVGNIVIPDRIIIGDNIFTVVAIGDQAFDYCRDLNTISLPNTIKSIGYASFYWCDKLTTIVLPSSLISVGRYAFEKCNGITAITIPNQVESIAEWAFYDNLNLQTISLPASLKTIGEAAISFCPKLTNINVAPGNTNFSTSNGVLFNFDKTTLISFPNLSSTNYTLPQSVTSIANWAFAGCENLTTVALSQTLESIGNNAFSWSNLKTINLPGSLKALGDGAFRNCTQLNDIQVSNGNTNFSSLEGVLFNINKSKLIAYPNNKSATYTVPQTVVTIGNRAFAGCIGITNILLPSALQTIENSSFIGCTNLTNINFPNSLQSIGEFAFQNCQSITAITLPHSLTQIGMYAFSICTNLGSIIWPSNVTVINEGMFWRSSKLNTFDIPANVSKIERVVFNKINGLSSISTNANNQIYSSHDGVLFNKSKSILICYPNSKSTTYTVPQSVDSISPDGFRDCVDLQKITLPSSIRTIANVAFDNCNTLTNINIERNIPPTAFINTFRGVNKQLCILKVPANTKPTYQSSIYWNQFENITDDNSTSTENLSNLRLSIYAFMNSIVIEGTNPNETIQIFSISGKLLHNIQSTIEKIVIPVTKGQMYFIKTNEGTKKVYI